MISTALNSLVLWLRSLWFCDSILASAAWFGFVSASILNCAIFGCVLRNKISCCLQLSLDFKMLNLFDFRPCSIFLLFHDSGIYVLFDFGHLTFLTWSFVNLALLFISGIFTNTCCCITSAFWNPWFLWRYCSGFKPDLFEFMITTTRICMLWLHIELLGHCVQVFIVCLSLVSRHIYITCRIILKSYVEAACFATSSVGTAHRFGFESLVSVHCHV